jgi:glutamyl-tRNA synthetase
LGHARTFWIAQLRARAAQGVLILRNEDLDPPRSRPEFVAAMLEDLRWFGFRWQEGPDCGGPVGPYSQSERRELYLAALGRLRAGGFVYPCVCSRQDVLRALQAPHAGDDEPIYPGTCRPKAAAGQRSHSPDRVSATDPDWCRRRDKDLQGLAIGSPALTTVAGEGPAAARAAGADQGRAGTGRQCNWRFRVPDGEVIRFADENYGPQEFVAGRDFGDFVVWRHDDLPSYQLAVVVDDAAMGVTEVVRGEDLLRSTARQLLLYRALGLAAPRFYHCPLVTGESGARLAKRQAALSLRALRAGGANPESLRQGWSLAALSSPLAC